MEMRFFDFEVLPHWWLCVIGDLRYADLNTFNEDIKESYTVIDSDMPNARTILLDYMRDESFVKMGYNIKHYDLIILNGIYQGFSPEQTKILNDIIINPSLAYQTKEHMRISPFAKRKYGNIVYEDLMDDSAGSLKEKESVLGLSVLESSVDFNKENLTFKDKGDLIYYCKQDVYAAMQFYKEIVHPYSMNKLHLGKLFGIDEATCYKNTNASLVSKILGAVRTTYSDNEKIEIQLPDKIKQYCIDNLPANLITYILTHQEGIKYDLFNNDVSFGNGGIHSTYKVNNTNDALYVETTDDYILVNADGHSYYPSEMLEFNLLSRSVTKPKLFRDIFNERIALKLKDNLTPEEYARQRAYKLVLNTTFGASGNKYLDLYDPYMCTSVCRVGQIFLAAFANKIYKTIPEARIIQTNTDGATCYIPRSQLDKFIALQDEWSKISGIKMELDFVDKIWQRDVNNYLMVLSNGKIKKKGSWLNDTYLREGTVKPAAVDSFVCTKAITEYYLHGIDIIESIVKNTNIRDFIICCTKGPTYRGVVQRNTYGDVELFKANRVIATKDTSKGKLYKYKMFKGKLQYTMMPDTPDHCMLVNDDLSHYNFADLKKDIDYMYYVQKCADIMDMKWLKLSDGKIDYTQEFNYFND